MAGSLPASSVKISSGLYPRSVKPAPRPLPVHRFFLQFVRNPLRIVPEAAYHEGMVVRERRTGGKAAWITDPGLIEDVLLRNHGAGDDGEGRLGHIPVYALPAASLASPALNLLPCYF